MRHSRKFGCWTLLLLLGIGSTSWLSLRLRQPLLLAGATPIADTHDWMHGNRMGGWSGYFWMSPHTLLFFRTARNPTVDDRDFGFDARMFRYDVNTKTETFLAAATRRFQTLGAYPGDFMQISPGSDWLIWRNITWRDAFGVKLDGSCTFCLDPPPDREDAANMSLPDGRTAYLLPDGKRWMEILTRQNKTSYARVQAFDSPKVVQELPLSAPAVRAYLAPREQFAATKIAADDKARFVWDVTFSPQQDRVAWTQRIEQRPSRQLTWLRRLFRLTEQETTTTTTLWVSRPDGSNRHCLGATDRIDFLKWTPEGTRLSFLHDDTLWAVPAK